MKKRNAKSITLIIGLLTISSLLNNAPASPTKPAIHQESRAEVTPPSPDSNNIIKINALIVAVTTGIASSLAASFLFWFVLYRKKPVIEVSSQILKVLDHAGNLKHYLIKVVNHTKADITNVKYELILEEISSQYEIEIDTSDRLEKILSRIKNETPRLQKKSTIIIFKTPLKLGLHGDRKELMAIEKYIHPIKDVNGEALYAQLFAIVPQHQPDRKSLDELLADNNRDRPSKYLVFNLYAEHSTSGFGQFFSKKYSQSNIHDGKRFKWGKSTEIE